MSDINIILEKIDGIYDIHPPIEPMLSLFENSLILLGLIMFIGGVLYISWGLLYSHKGRNKRKIKSLQKIYRDKNISDHETIYQLCFYLRQGLQLNYIGKETSLPKKLMPHREKWLEFINNVSDLRYKNNQQLTPNIEKAFKESLFWLRKWP